MDIPEKLAILGTQDARRRQTQHNMCQTPLHASNVKKDTSPPQATGGKERLKHRFYLEIVVNITTRKSECKDT
jgi:hypothetical protein